MPSEKKTIEEKLDEVLEVLNGVRHDIATLQDAQEELIEKLHDLFSEYANWER